MSFHLVAHVTYKTEFIQNEWIWEFSTMQSNPFPWNQLIWFWDSFDASVRTPNKISTLILWILRECPKHWQWQLLFLKKKKLGTVANSNVTWFRFVNIHYTIGNFRNFFGFKYMIILIGHVMQNAKLNWNEWKWVFYLTLIWIVIVCWKYEIWTNTKLKTNKIWIEKLILESLLGFAGHAILISLTLFYLFWDAIKFVVLPKKKVQTNFFLVNFFMFRWEKHEKSKFM